MSKTYTNSGKSVKERLLNLSRAEHYNPQMMISRYMQERLLYRLSISNYRERFILKGGALLILTLPVSEYLWISVLVMSLLLRLKNWLSLH